jgi:hypothetical protein
MHVRSVVTPLLSLAVIAAPLPLVVLGAGQAVAANGDVLTMERFTATTSASRTSTSATFTAFGPTNSSGPSGANVRFDYTQTVTLAPPSGARFVAGQTYPAAATATATAAMLRPSTGVFSNISCPTSNVAQLSGSVHVLAAAYDVNGLLTEFAADYTGMCTTSTSSTETVSGSVRHASTLPWLSLLSSYVKDVVPRGRERVRDVIITGTAVGGKTVTLGAASLGGQRSADYRVTDNGCLNAVLGDGDSCHVSVAFRPLDYSNDPTDRIATLVVAASGHVSDAVRVRLNSQRTELPTAPRVLSAYPTSDGLGLSWTPSASGAQQYVVERKRAGESDWTTVTTVQDGDLPNYVDPDVQPGEQASYRVTPSNFGWDGDSATTTGTRPTNLPVATDRQMMHLDYEFGTDGPRHVTITKGDPGATFNIFGGQSPGIIADHSQDATSQRIGFSVPVVSSPGIYRDDAAGDVSDIDAISCTLSHRVLVVRHVLYDETRAPVVLDASWAGICEDNRVVRLEIRLGADSSDAQVTTDPMTIGRLTTFGGGSADASVTVTNSGPASVALGAATVSGPAAGDWHVTTNACDGQSLAPGEDCSVTVTFTSSADQERPGVLELAQNNSEGGLAPVVVALDGFGATPPAPPIGDATGSIDAILLKWRVSDDGGMPVQSFDVERKDETSGWAHVATVPMSARSSWVDRALPTGHGLFDYRVRAVNDVGASDWQTVGFNFKAPGHRAVVVSGRTGPTGLRGLHQLTRGVVDTPVIPLTNDSAHDYRTAAVTPAGTRLAVAVSTGDGRDGEYDLWTGTLAAPKVSHLTTMAGAERDPAYSPDTSQIAFTHVASGGQRSVWVVAVAGGTPRLVRDGAAQPTWTLDGSRLIVEDDSAPTAPLLYVDPTTGETTTTVPDSAGGGQPAIALDGTIAWVATDGSVRKLAPGASTSMLVRGTAGGTAGNPAFADDGQLTWDSTRNDTDSNVSSMTTLLEGIVEPAPVRDDVSAPQLALTGPTGIVRGSANWTVTTSDDVTPAVALRPECRLDNGAWLDCRAGGSADHLSDGPHRIEARVADEAGHQRTGAVTFVSDIHPPTLVVTAPTVAQAAGGAPTFRWTGRDGAPGVLVYDVAVNTARPASPFTTYSHPAGWGSTDARTGLVVRAAPGQETCVRVRARDAAGMWSAYVTRCVARPLDDAPLRVSKGWKRERGAGRYQSTESVVAKKGATIQTARAVTTRRVGVMATTCAKCGAVQVLVGSRLLGTVSLVSARTVRQQVRYVRLPAAAVTGIIRLRTTSARSVAVDGLLLARN